VGLPVILTPQSQKDLKTIVRYIARDNPQQAKKFGYVLIDKALSLTSMPERGRVVPELNDPAVREIVHENYRIRKSLSANARWTAVRLSPCPTKSSFVAFKKLEADDGHVPTFCAEGCKPHFTTLRACFGQAGG